MKYSIPLFLMRSLIFGASVFLTACDREFGLPPVTETNIIAAAEEFPELSTLLTALDRAGLTDTLAVYSPFTLFAPTNEAFAASQLNVNQISVDSLQAILSYHIVTGRYLTDFFQNDSIRTFTGDFIRVRRVNEGVNINRNTNIINGNKEAKNGMIHIIDRVLIR